MSKKETILIIGAHSDDFVIGAGGTLAKYVQEGKKVISLVFSYGEKSHPWLKEKVIQKIRSKEAHEASKIIGCKTTFCDLKELDFIEEFKKKNLEKEFLDIIHKEKPTKIFTHSPEDPHPDHKASYKITMELYEKIKFSPKPELYIYSVWNPVSFKTNYPSLYVDVSKTFFLKLKALRKFDSQLTRIIYPIFLLFSRAIRDGLRIRKKFGEQFFRIK